MLKAIVEGTESLLVFLGLTLIIILATGCGATPKFKQKAPPKAGDLEYIDKQVYQCRALCASGSIDTGMIKGLNCVCNNRPQPQPASAPIIVMPQGNHTPAPAPVIVVPTHHTTGDTSTATTTNNYVYPAQVSPTTKTNVYTPMPSQNATRINDRTGKEIVSQSSEKAPKPQVTKATTAPARTGVTQEPITEIPPNLPVQ